jgi:hypothetical protein
VGVCPGGVLGLLQGGVLMQWKELRLILGDVAVGMLLGLLIAQMF